MTPAGEEREGYELADNKKHSIPACTGSGVSIPACTGQGGVWSTDGLAFDEPIFDRIYAIPYLSMFNISSCILSAFASWFDIWSH